MTLYFRIKDNGASVFRMNDDVRSQRLEMSPVAEANVRNGSIKPRGGAALTDQETSQIEAWIANRRAKLAEREAAIPDMAVEAVNAAAHWISGKPDPAIADQSAEALLFAMHDLRAAIVRHKANRLADAASDGARDEA